MTRSHSIPTPGATASGKLLQRSQIYRVPNEDGSFPERSENEQRALDSEVAEWWGLVRPTI